MKHLFTLTLLFIAMNSGSQVVIDSIQSAPHPTAMLDIKSGTKGILVPRLSTSQRLSIVKPAAGLLVYDNEDQAFYYYRGEVGWVSLISNWDIDGIDLPFNVSRTTASNLFGIIQQGTGSTANLSIDNPANTNNALKLTHNGSGNTFSTSNSGTAAALIATNSNPASTSSTALLEQKGIGSGLNISLTNASNGARGIDVMQAGVGPGVFATSAGGTALWGITSSISAAGVIGDNTFGEAVVGRNRGGNGVGAVVGRNDSSGYGARGFNTKNGIGVLGQSGISGGTGVGGRFENVNAANTNDALQAGTNGTGYAANITNSNNSSSSKGVRISTTANQGGIALNIANGRVMASYIDPYVSNTTIDDLHLIIRAQGNNILSSTNVQLGTIVYVTNFSGGTVTITNTTVGNYSIPSNRANQFIYFGANIWTPVQ